MSSLSEGSNIKIKSFKHNDKLHRVWESNIILFETEDTFITINDQTIVKEADGRSWRTKDPAIGYFSRKYWFNVVAIIQPNGIYYYCNLASPVRFIDGALHYIDYDLDVVIDESGERHLLDQKEYQQNSTLLNYPYEVKHAIERDLKVLYQWMDNTMGPFEKEFVSKWFNKYQQLDVKWDESQ